MGEYSHLKNVSDKIHLSGGAIDLLVGTDFVEDFTDIHSVWRTWRAHQEKKLLWTVRSGTVRVKLLHPIWNSVNRSRDSTCRGRYQETSLPRHPWSQTNQTLCLHWKCITSEQVREVLRSFNYFGRWENTSEDALERRRASKTKELRHHSEEDVLCWKGISEKGLLRGCKRGRAEVVRPQLYHEDSTWTNCSWQTRMVPPTASSVYARKNHESSTSLWLIFKRSR